jgi:hypothetical protein
MHTASLFTRGVFENRFFPAAREWIFKHGPGSCATATP